MFATGFPVTPHSYFHFFGYWIFGVSSVVKYRILDEGVEEVGVGVIKELVDKQGQRSVRSFLCCIVFVCHL